MTRVCQESRSASSEKKDVFAFFDRHCVFFFITSDITQYNDPGRTETLVDKQHPAQRLHSH